MEAHAFNPSGQEAAADRRLWIQGQTGLHDKFQDNQSYRESHVSINIITNKHIDLKRYFFWFSCSLSETFL